MTVHREPHLGKQTIILILIKRTEFAAIYQLKHACSCCCCCSLQARAVVDKAQRYQTTDSISATTNEHSKRKLFHTLSVTYFVLACLIASNDVVELSCVLRYYIIEFPQPFHIAPALPHFFSSTENNGRCWSIQYSCCCWVCLW